MYQHLSILNQEITKKSVDLFISLKTELVRHNFNIFFLT